MVYIDFWASWCSPCREDISKSVTAKQYLKEKDIVFLYISIDRKENSWREAVIADDITQHQYLLLDVVNTPISYLLQSIPRYIILNEERKMVNANAPKPIPEKLFDLKNCVENLLK